MRRPSIAHIARAFVVSLGLHGAAFVWVKVRPAAAEPATDVSPTDVWSGAGIELDDAPVETDSTTPSVIHDASEPAVVANVDLDTAPPAQASRARAPESSLAGVTTTQRKPKKKPVTAEKRATSEPRVSSAGSPATDTSSTPSSSAPGAAFGSAGLPPGVRYLPKAFTRALSQGGWGVSGFRTASPGTLCEASLSIAVTDDHGVGPVDYGGESKREALEPLCRTLFENARRLIANGEFSLDPKSLASGVMRLHVTVTVSDGEPHDDALGEDAPHGLSSESFEPVAPGRRGRSSFTLNSGRRVDAFVELG